jgi:protein-disulfide isomerase
MKKKKKKERQTKKLKKQVLSATFLSIFAFVILVIIFTIYFTALKPGRIEYVKVRGQRQPTLGSLNSTITIIEYSDFQCPFCAVFAKKIFPRLNEEYIKTKKVKFIFRNFAFLGEESNFAAQASECAYQQDRFWEYHEYLFSNQKGENKGEFSKKNLKKFAKELGLNTEKFNKCLQEEKYKNEVEKDRLSGESLRVNSTPTIFINGREIKGIRPYYVYKNIIEEELEK